MGWKNLCALLTRTRTACPNLTDWKDASLTALARQGHVVDVETLNRAMRAVLYLEDR